MTEYECDICRDVFPTPSKKRQHTYETHKEKSRNQCEACYRIISDVAKDRWDVVRFQLVRMSFLSEEVFAEERQEGAPAKLGPLCGPCAEEFLELANEMSSVDLSPDLIMGDKEWWEFTKCNLCGDQLERTRGGLRYSWGGPGFNNWESHVLCDSCVGIVATFLDNLPEGVREGDYFYGRKTVEVETSVEEADFKSIRETYQGLEIDDEVHVEVHRPMTENHPRDYRKFDGIVVDRRSLDNLTAVCISPHSGPGEYRIMGPSVTRHSFDAQHVATDGSGNGDGQIGEVTVLEKMI